MNGRVWPIAAFVLAMVSFQCGASFATHLFGTIGAQGATALRVGFSAVMLAVVLRPWRARPVRAAWPWLVAYGVSLGVMNLSFYLALRTVPLGVTVAIEFWGPLAVALAGSRRPSDFLWIALAIFGLALLLPLTGAHAIDPLGAGFALLAGLGWATYIIAGTRAGGLVPPMQVAALGMIVAALVVVPIGVVHAGRALLAPDILLFGLAIAALSSAIPYLLEMVMLTRMPPRIYGTLASLEPVAGAIAGLLLIGQHLGLVEWGGIAAIMAAAAGAALAMRPVKGEPA